MMDIIMVDQTPWIDPFNNDPLGDTTSKDIRGDTFKQDLRKPNKHRGCEQIGLLGNPSQLTSSQKISIPKAPAYEFQQNKQDQKVTDHKNVYKPNEKKFAGDQKNVYKPPEKKYTDDHKKHNKNPEKKFADEHKHYYKHSDQYSDDQKVPYKTTEKKYTDDRNNVYKSHDKYSDDHKHYYKPSDKFSDERSHLYKSHDKSFDDRNSSYKSHDKKTTSDHKNTYKPEEQLADYSQTAYQHERTPNSNRYMRNNRTARRYQAGPQASRGAQNTANTSYHSIEGLGEMYPDIPYGVLKDKFNQFKNDPDRLLAEVEAYKQNSIDDRDICKFYKTKPCPLKDECNNPQCFNYHCKAERRRRHDIKNYKPILCQAAGRCKYGNECYYAHTINEVLYHPSRYQALNCSMKDGSNKCMLGKYCCYNHYIREDELSDGKKKYDNGKNPETEKRMKEIGTKREERSVEEVEETIQAREEFKKNTKK